MQIKLFAASRRAAALDKINSIFIDNIILNIYKWEQTEIEREQKKKKERWNHCVENKTSALLRSFLWRPFVVGSVLDVYARAHGELCQSNRVAIARCSHEWNWAMHLYRCMRHLAIQNKWVSYAFMSKLTNLQCQSGP